MVPEPGICDQGADARRLAGRSRRIGFEHRAGFHETGIAVAQQLGRRGEGGDILILPVQQVEPFAVGRDVRLLVPMAVAGPAMTEGGVVGIVADRPPAHMQAGVVMPLDEAGMDHTAPRVDHPGRTEGGGELALRPDGGDAPAGNRNGAGGKDPPGVVDGHDIGIADQDVAGVGRISHRRSPRSRSCPSPGPSNRGSDRPVRAATAPCARAGSGCGENPRAGTRSNAES
jgi:hypothetical protein